MSKISRFLNSLVICILSFQLISCGTILYPERKGQKGGRLDIGVVLLDAVGLLFFFIPGIIAFAVDFSNGTIYLPHTDVKTSPRNYRIVKFDPRTTSSKKLEKIIQNETGQPFRFKDERLEQIRISQQDDIPVCFTLSKNSK